ncbi:hypothetical protein CLI64_13495 [Nostoc sp. CENA543]|uniref:hypothetical protein n=1 Tax=Nostoc sp. CENA543 TaxID=1869241 RepID=UPI000CA28CEC|nr:hypothetical protein [Nostoc sp. CENA543]AUT01331.1 hypothetical protein CLI64_13495 [Nostoc sp. CENA543]
MTQWLALLISLVIEIPVVFFILVIMRQLSLDHIYKVLIFTCGATLFTHPLAWESNQILIPYMEFPWRLGLIEIIVAIAEGILYKITLNLAWRQGLFISIMANTASFLGGLFIAQFLG